MKEVFAAYC